MTRAALVAAALLALAAGAAAEDRRCVVALRGRDEAGLDALLRRQQDPRSADFRRYLTPREFGRRFGSRGRDLRRASRWLRASARRVRRHASRRLLAAECPPGRLEIPGDLRGVVTAVLGTDGPPPVAFRLAAGPIRPLATVGGRFVLTPAEFARIYGLDGLGVDGAGQTIGIVALSRIDPADVAAFRTAFGLPPADLVVVGAVRLPGTAAELEALLDATWSGAVAPRARVEVAAGVIVVDALAHLVDQADVGIISLSLGFCRSPQTKPFVREANRLFRQAAAQGQAVLVASGDTGPFCGGRRGTDELASSPLVTAVGGTTPSPVLDAGGAATGYGTEAVWQDDDGASGGGVTRRGRPAYQRGRPRRTIPDVAFPAASMYPLGVGGRVGCCVGGTSAAAPTWAGVAALLGQAEGRRLGPLNPRLYQLGRAQARGGPAAFHDVTEGSNSLPAGRGFAARPGYDLATGWGTVAGAVLFDAF